MVVNCIFSVRVLLMKGCDCISVANVLVITKGIGSGH